VTRECKQCGTPFTIHIAQTKRPGDGRYCSRSCARRGSPTKTKASPIVECVTCGKRFNKYQAEIKKNVGSKHFCSPNCWYSFNQRDNHYLWQGGQDGRMSLDGRLWRKKILARDRGLCRICLSPRRVEAHHILSFTTHPETRWELSNGITLCRDCHKQIHRQQKRHPEDVNLLRLMAETRLVFADELHTLGPEQEGDSAASP
jgi:5-methylcytosine-specific restriction endonuclease McrA